MRGLPLGRIGLSAGFLCAGLPFVVLADAWDKKSYVTLSEPVEVPGAVLQPGQYVFQLADAPSNRHVVQILTADANQVRANAPAISSFRVQVAEKTVLTFYEMPGGRPHALKSWYYPGDSYGQRFAYPKSRATEIARLTGQHVPILPENQEAAETLASPERAARPRERSAGSVPKQPSVPAADPAPAEAETRLRENSGDATRTSDLPLAGLIGATTVLAAVGLRVLTKRFVTKRFV